MVDLRNELAIILTRAIQEDLYMLCADITRVDANSIRQAPNFIHIRTKILGTLENLMDVLQIESRISPMIIDQMRPERAKQFMLEDIRKKSVMLVEKIMSSPDHFRTVEFDDDFGMYRNTLRQIVVLKSAKIFEQSFK